MAQALLLIVLLSVKDLLRNYSVKLLSPHSILINQLSSRTVLANMVATSYM